MITITLRDFIRNNAKFKYNNYLVKDWNGKTVYTVFAWDYTWDWYVPPVDMWENVLLQKVDYIYEYIKRKELEQWPGDLQRETIPEWNKILISKESFDLLTKKQKMDLYMSWACLKCRKSWKEWDCFC